MEMSFRSEDRGGVRVMMQEQSMLVWHWSVQDSASGGEANMGRS